MALENIMENLQETEHDLQVLIANSEIGVGESWVLEIANFID